MMYVFIKKCEDGCELVSITEDPVALFKNGEYNAARGDKLYQLGSEVKVKTTLEQVKKYRSINEKIRCIECGEYDCDPEGVGHYRG